MKAAVASVETNAEPKKEKEKHMHALSTKYIMKPNEAKENLQRQYIPVAKVKCQIMKFKHA